ncbi:hypothetical protein D7V97_08405 [Corallococcus sp. CA053C]|uniref:hypothetical protein n=1 Tax=Corallococcus sp. CA053C TaxID=2316732 RepID=UPI000EA04F76|nr:hypothetical protein [Corallococcus sp. CA053C]RKH12449.1 hypothetical protein D7V97_08405 [Corallococcus sp. CA053C]
MGMKDDVQQEYEELKNHFKKTSFDDFRSGDWFSTFVQWMLTEYAKQVDADYLRRKYPGAGARNQAKKAVDLASKYAGVAGGASAAAVTGLELAGLGPQAIVAVPAIGAAVMADIGFTTRLQLRTTYDLSVLHRAPLCLDDAEDCYLIFMTALGIKLSEVAGGFVKAVGPQIVQYNMRRFLRNGFRAALVEIIKKVAGSAIARKLTEKAILRVLVPGISIPISASANYAFTRSMLKVANKQMQRRGYIIEPLLKLYSVEKDFPRDFVVQSLIVMMESPRREGWDEEQMNSLRQTQSFLALSDAQVSALENWFDRTAADLAASLPKMDSRVAAALVEFLARCAALGDPSGDAAYSQAIEKIARAIHVDDIPSISHARTAAA